MSTENSTTYGTPLKNGDRRAIRAELVRLARQTGARAYQYAWDGEKKVQFRAFPDGRCTIEPVTNAGLSVGPPLRLTATGVPARWLGVATVALAVAAEVLTRVS